MKGLARPEVAARAGIQPTHTSRPPPTCHHVRNGPGKPAAHRQPAKVTEGRQQAEAAHRRARSLKTDPREAARRLRAGAKRNRPQVPTFAHDVPARSRSGTERDDGCKTSPFGNTGTSPRVRGIARNVRQPWSHDVPPSWQSSTRGDDGCKTSPSGNTATSPRARAAGGDVPRPRSHNVQQRSRSSTRRDEGCKTTPSGSTATSSRVRATGRGRSAPEVAGRAGIPSPQISTSRNKRVPSIAARQPSHRFSSTCHRSGRSATEVARRATVLAKQNETQPRATSIALQPPSHKLSCPRRRSGCSATEVARRATSLARQNARRRRVASITFQPLAHEFSCPCYES